MEKTIDKTHTLGYSPPNNSLCCREGRRILHVRGLLMTACTKQRLLLRSTIRLLIAGTALALVGVGAVRMNEFVEPPSTPQAVVINGLAVAAEHLNFGEAWENLYFEWLLPIENRHNQDVQIERLYLSCTCLKADPSELVIPAGRTREVRLTLDLTARERQTLPPPICATSP